MHNKIEQFNQLQGIEMITQNTTQPNNDGPTCKKIQNYIFKFSDLLGQGNFSKVYKAHHEITDQIVAIKIVELNSLKSKKLQQLLFSQINVLKKLNHPNILRCFQVFTSNRNCYIITELCNQGDLQTKLRRRQYFTQEAAEPIIRDIFQGLLYLAEQNVIHRDLKIANVFIHNSKAKIADFGFAKFTKTKFKDINIGSPIYMSPQGFIDNIYGPKTDIWAFGVLIYELLHGETPFNFCKTQSELKYHLSIPLSRNKLKPQISPQLQQVILRCMQIDEEKRITAFQLGKLPYFEKILKKSSVPLSLKIDSNSNASTHQYRMKSPSFVTKDQISAKTSHSVHFDSNTFQNRRISFDRNPRQNHFFTGNIGNSFERGVSPLNGFKNQNNAVVHQIKRDNFFSTRNFDTLNYQKPAQNQEYRVRQRGITTDKRRISIHNGHEMKSIQKRQGGLHIVSNSRLPKVVSDRLTFKQAVNLLHYGRLIFKYVTFLRQQQNWQQTYLDEVYTLTKWLFVILDEVAQKIQAKDITFQGGSSAQVREKKLIQVTAEYQKKYRKQLQAQLIEINLKDKFSLINLDYMKNFLYNQYLRYDKTLTSNSQISKNVLYFGHNIMMIYEATRLLKKCYDEKNYYLLENYKDVELFLSKNKDTMDMQAYKQKRKKMTIYA